MFVWVSAVQVTKKAAFSYPRNPDRSTPIEMVESVLLQSRKAKAHLCELPVFETLQTYQGEAEHWYPSNQIWEAQGFDVVLRHAFRQLKPIQPKEAISHHRI